MTKLLRMIVWMLLPKYTPTSVPRVKLEMSVGARERELSRCAAVMALTTEFVLSFAAPRSTRHVCGTGMRITWAPHSDLRRAKVDDFRMSVHLVALRPAVLPAARDGAERLKTSFLTTPARDTRSQIAIP